MSPVPAAGTAPAPAPLARVDLPSPRCPADDRLDDRGGGHPIATLAAPAPSDQQLVLPETLQGILESAITERADPQIRAAVILGIIDEVYQTTAWWYGADRDHPELLSLAQVVAAAQAHLQRVAGSAHTLERTGR